jgi:sugar-phosphatase
MFVLSARCAHCAAPPNPMQANWNHARHFVRGLSMSHGRKARRLDVIIQASAVLFDMDGVLIDSTECDERCWLRWASLRGMSGTFSVSSTHGRRATDTVRMVRPDLDPHREVKLLEQFAAEESHYITVLPGVEALLAALPHSQWGIVTSASEHVARHRLTAAGIGLPQVLVTAEMVEKGKPNPEPYQLGAQLLGYSSAECLVIEDAPSGILAGKAAGSHVLAVASSHSMVDLNRADWTVKSLTAVDVVSAETDRSKRHSNEGLAPRQLNIGIRNILNST